MREQLKIIITLNSDDNIKLVLKEIKKLGFEIQWKRANSIDILNDLFHINEWDIIISEEIIKYNFTALDILKRRKELNLETPLVLFCENIQNENLIQIMNNGCSYCIFKNNISSLGSIVVEEILKYRVKLQKTKEMEEIKKNYDTLNFDVRRYKLAIEGSNDGIWEWDAVNNKGYISFKWKQTLNIDSCEFDNFIETLMELIHSEDLDVVEEALNDYLDKKTPYFICEFRLKTKDSDYIWVLCKGKSNRDNSGKVIKIAGSLTDITSNKKAEEKINYLAYYDTITDLANRTLFEERLNKCISSSKKHKEIFGLLYLDLDNFKSVNDTLGHAYGDLLLKDVANLLKKHIGRNDLVARLSGDEFAVLIRKLNSTEKLKNLAESIKNEFQNPFILANHEVYVTVSIGIVLYPVDGEEQQTLFKNADTAMYHAKESGKNSYQFYNPEMNIMIMEKLRLQNDLRRALKNEEFEVYYQPQVNIETGEIVGFEALVRWIHPTEGIVSPLKFIPEAEEMGLICEIGEFVLRSVCRQNKTWQQMGYAPGYVAVNLSARQFQQKNLAGMIEAILRETGLEPKWLELEITESICMNDLDFTINMLHKFNEMGIKVALDDFGTGYSSLNYLKQLPIQILKIDKSFVDDITSNPKQLAIAKAITTLAHTMELQIVAEGVEIEEQLLILKELKCDKAQGYLFSRPLPAEGIGLKLQRPGI